MSIYDRHQRDEVERLVEDVRQQRIGRRAFIQRAMAAGLAASSAGTLLAACDGGGGTTNPGSTRPSQVDVLNVWGGEEQDSFRAVVAPFTRRTKVNVNIESTRDLDAALTERLRGNNPPDIAILPNPGKMQQLAEQNKLIRLDTFLNMGQINIDYHSSWVDLGTYNGGFYALFYKTTNKGTIWYNPAQFRAAGLQIPVTWSDLIAVSNKLVSSGKYPWSIGVESGAASGWPAADWIAEIYLNQSGPVMYDKWVAHKIPWTDASIKSAFHIFGQIVAGKHYIKGAPPSILATGFQDATYAPFSKPPRAYMYYLGDFAAGFITSKFSTARPGTDFNFFPFPTINQEFQGSVTGGADVVVAMKDNGAVRELITYLATAAAQAIWVKRGGFTSANKSLDLNAYPNAVAQASARMLTEARSFKFGAGDLMPPAVQQAFWKGTLAFIRTPRQLDSVLSAIESAAQQAYPL
ncbi:MAG: carbohydrate ABC transporter substrate-binding protein [Ktedonobacteraceae bacterium]|nr:carbohydrate ABC transporter substrate-binding protein [Ktedonobacteraceae bacterium]